MDRDMAAECVLQDLRIGSNYIGIIAARDAFDLGASTSEIVATAWSMAKLLEPDRDAKKTARRLSHFVLDCTAHAVINGVNRADVEAAATAISSARQLVDAATPCWDILVSGQSLQAWAYGSKFDAAWSTACAILQSGLGAERSARHDPMILAQTYVAPELERDEIAWQDQRLKHWLLSARPQPLPFGLSLSSAA